MMFEDFFIIKDNGVLFFSWNNGTDEKGKYYHDLITPFLSALDLFTGENFGGRSIRSIELDDGMKIYFKNLNIGGATGIKIVGVFPEGFASNKFGMIEKKMLPLKWELGKWVDHVNSSNAIPPNVEKSIRKRIATEFVA